MKKNHKPLLMLLFSLLASAGQAAENWSVLPGEDSASLACHLTTPHLNMDDGQGETTVWLEITGDTLLVAIHLKRDIPVIPTG